ncbi:SERTA domain-containing protein 3 [Collariella sp. IMI 366227]|nr:SERTA domain-containing protein 3 [Collariella sp. IMI 366227]
MHNFKNLDNTGPRQLHSGLAPIFPDLDARNYASTGPQLQNCTVIPKPSDSGLDQLFDTKRAQVQANHGMPTWEMAVLNEYLVNGWHGGHQSVGEMGPGPDADVLDHGFGVQVDEGKWHAVFERGNEDTLREIENLALTSDAWNGQQTKTPFEPVLRRCFTMTELQRQKYIDPALGLYCAIDGEVYNLGRYLNSHPGAPRSSASTPAAMRQTPSARHTPTGKKLCANTVTSESAGLSKNAPSTRILTTTRSPSTTKSTASQTSSKLTPFSHSLQPYFGTNATATLEATLPKAFCTLLPMEELVCAKFAAKPVKVTATELAKRYFVPTEEERRKVPKEGIQIGGGGDELIVCS